MKTVAPDANAAAVDAGAGNGAGAADAGAGGVKPDAGAAATDKGAAENAKADPSKKDDLAPAEPAEPVVRQRKSNKDYIIERKEAKIKKLAEANAAGKPNDGGDDARDDESDDDDVAIEERISRAVDQRLSPLLERQQEEEDSREVETVMKEFPELADLTPKLKEWMKHPSRQHIPARSILYELAGSRLMKIGAERERKAVEAAKQTQTGGGTQRNDGGDKKPQDMDDKEFAAYTEGIKNSR